MRIVVCLKPVLDPELDPRSFRLDASGREPAFRPHELVTDPSAEMALELAVQWKETVGGTEVAALALANDTAIPMLRRALAVGANRMVQAWEEGWEALDAQGTARVLAAAIRAMGGADLVLVGQASADLQQGLVGPLLAGELCLPCFDRVRQMAQAEPGWVRLRQEAADGQAVLEHPLPALLAVTRDLANQPRLPRLKPLMAASRLVPLRHDGASLNLELTDLAPHTALRGLSTPSGRGACRFMADAAELALWLVREGVIKP